MNTIFDAYTKILTEELKPALGCTEPVAIAFASASAAKALGTSFTSITVKCSGNVVKNVKSVTVPNSGGMKGIEAAALLGALGGNASLHLEVLSTVTDEIRNKVKEIVNSGICKVILAEDIPGLYISVTAENGSDSATAVLKECHDELYSLSKNGKLIINNGTKENSDDNLDELRKLLNLKDILSYAKNVEIDEIRKPLKRQVELNRAIAEEGLRKNYGCSIGKTLKKLYDWDDVRIRARAYASAGSDARMSGCSLPVVINSGSGNQGLTVSLPVVEYGEYLRSTE
ncbi:L-serine ammonia-lyase, iron-sulfur-dependent, subunit alpha, partial [Bullifex porci]